MRGFRQLRAAAKRRREELGRRIDEDVAAGRPIDLSAIKDEIATLDAVASVRAPKERIVHAAIPLLLALIALAAAWLIRVPAPDVVVEITTTRVVLGLAAPAAASPDALGGIPPLTRLTAEGLDEVRSDDPVLRVRATAGQAGTIEIADGRIAVARIEFAALRERPGSGSAPLSLSIERVGTVLRLGTTGLATTVRVATEAPARIATRFGEAVVNSSPRAASLELVGGPRTLLSLRLASDSTAVDLPVLRPHSLQFQRPYFAAQGAPVQESTLRQGSVSFHGGARRLDLPPGATLDLGELRGVARLRAESGAIQLTFVGRAGRMELKSGDTDHDLRPSLAEWLAADRDVALAWSALLFLTGLALTMRRSVA